MEIIDQTAKVVMLKGEGGDTIKSIDKTTTQGLVDIYTITLESGNKTTFNVTNGNGIKTIEKTSTSGLIDTYTITFDNGETTTFNVTNGEKGEKGDKGDTGPQGPQGPKGEKGDPGDGGGIANVDTELSTTSTNPVQNKVIAEGINSIQTQIVPTASIEIGATASKAYNVGDFLVKDGTLYKVTKDIAQGDTLTVGTNIVMTTVGSELSGKSNSFAIKEVLHVASTPATATDYTTEPLDDYDFFIVSCGVLGFRPGALYNGSMTGFYSKAELLDTSNYSTGTHLKVYDTDGAVGPRIINLKYVNNTSIKLWYAGAYSSEVRIYGIKC